jgi:uncharacterized protein (TIGR02284 family)
VSTATIEIRDVVNRLIEVCHDGERGYAAASQALPADDMLLKSELAQYGRQRKEFAADLEAELAQFGEEPVGHGTISAALHRGWMNLKQAMTANQRGVILAECERAEDAALAAYREAMSTAMPSPIDSLVETQYEALKRVHDRVRMLREASKAS